MKRIALYILLITVFAGFAGNAFCESGIIPPPALNVPYGGKIVTELNFSDNDVLGMLKGLIPVFNTLWTRAAGSGVCESLGVQPDIMKKLSGIDLKPLADATSGVKNVRMIVVKYGNDAKAERMMSDINVGVAKMGMFSKVAMDSAMAPGGALIYAEANNGGYAAFMFDKKSHTLYAGRLVGFVDVPRIVGWVTEIGMLFGEKSQTPAAIQATPAPVSDNQPAQTPAQ